MIVMLSQKVKKYCRAREKRLQWHFFSIRRLQQDTDTLARRPITIEGYKRRNRRKTWILHDRTWCVHFNAPANFDRPKYECYQRKPRRVARNANVIEMRVERETYGSIWIALWNALENWT